MIKGIYTSASGMLPRMTGQEVIANNLANINTPGYKRDGVFLKTLLAAGQPLSGSFPEWREGEIEGLYIDFSPGPLQQTHRKLDLAIEGDGFFVVSTPEGERYTRNGSFTMGTDGLLTASDGAPVLGEAGPIALTGQEVLVNHKGEIFADGKYVDKLLIKDFQRPYQLLKTGNGVFAPKDGVDSGEPAEGARVHQGFLEQSNVKAIEEMVDMLVSYRQYESAQKAIQIQDDSLGKAVNELGAVK